MKCDSYKFLLNYSFWLLGRKSYTEKEISDRLKRRAIKIKLPQCESVIKKVIKRLRELNYVDDDKILENYFEYRLKVRPVGRFRFLQEMYKRGIPFERARSEWEKREIDEEQLALDLIQAKKRQFKGLSAILRKKKIVSLLAGRGFSSETVWGVFGKTN